MIFSDHQYAVSEGQLAKLRLALAGVDADSAKHERLRKIEADALRSVIGDIEDEIAEYDLLKSLKSGSEAFASGAAHLHWCRVRAEAYLARGEVSKAWDSFVSDVKKRPETAEDNVIQSLLLIGTVKLAAGAFWEPNEMRKFLETFFS